MRKLPFNNESSQAERRAILKNERGGTYHDFAAAEAGAARGRFTAHEKSTVIGSAAGYPALPETSPWHHDPVPAEEPLGIDLSAAPVVGEAFEIERSLRGMNDGAGMNNPIEPSIDSPTSGEQFRRRHLLRRRRAGSPPLKRRGRR